MSDLRELYQQVILDHSKHPRNKKPLVQASHHAEGFNPLCGDKITLQVLTDGNSILDAAFDGSGCAISTASASMMTDALKGKKLSEVEELFKNFHDLVTTGKHEGPDLEKLEVFAGVSEFPLRVKCATLAWHTLNAALAKKEEPVSTE